MPFRRLASWSLALRLTSSRCPPVVMLGLRSPEWRPVRNIVPLAGLSHSPHLPPYRNLRLLRQALSAYLHPADPSLASHLLLFSALQLQQDTLYKRLHAGCRRRSGGFSQLGAGVRWCSTPWPITCNDRAERTSSVPATCPRLSSSIPNSRLLLRPGVRTSPRTPSK
ncbi:hypothetical protein OH77DRAFT_793691 [Trametes cingulata]|nr:hypothetical protein OH77DRAFT_793691 [Trametes cingulata]